MTPSGDECFEAERFGARAAEYGMGDACVTCSDGRPDEMVFELKDLRVDTHNSPGPERLF